MKLLGSTKSKITKDEKGKNVPRLEITEIVLIHCNQQWLTTRLKSIAYICFGQLLNFSPKNILFLKSFNPEFHVLMYGLLIKILNH